VQHLVDRVSAVFVPTVMVLSLFSFRRQAGVGRGRPAPPFTAAVAVLVVACPCALGLATPDRSNSSAPARRPARDRRQGPEVLEKARDVTVIALDKTGR